MKALLRFQAVVAWREFSNPLVLITLGLVPLSAWLAATADGFIAAVYAVVAFAVLAVLAVWGMSSTYEAMDAIRWSAPLPHRRVLAAHVVFWLAIFLPLVFVVAAFHSGYGAYLAMVLALVVTEAALLIPFFHRMRRRGGAVSLICGGLVAWLLVWPAAWSVVLVWTGRPEIGLPESAVVCAIATTIGLLSFRSEERSPAASGADVGRSQARIDERGPSAARSPVAILLRATYPPFRTALDFAFGGVLPLMFPSMYVFAIWTPLAASNAAGCGLQTWRWLAATPIDRDRAFRILFGPALAFVLVVAGVRLAIVETTSDRSVFFRDDRREGFRYVGSSTLTLAELLEIGPSGNGYRPAEVHRVAAGVRDHLRAQFGATVPLERIEANLGRAWPQQPTAGAVDDDMGYVLDGLERVRLDLADDIASTSRRRDLSIAAGLVLAFLAMLRAQFRGRVLGVLLVIVVVLPLVMLAGFRREFPAYAAAVDSAVAALTSAPPPVFWLALAGACTLGAFLWRSSRRAFRRIDLLDLPPNPLVSSKR